MVLDIFSKTPDVLLISPPVKSTSITEAYGVSANLAARIFSKFCIVFSVAKPLLNCKHSAIHFLTFRVSSVLQLCIWFSRLLSALNRSETVRNWIHLGMHIPASQYEKQWLLEFFLYVTWSLSVVTTHVISCKWVNVFEWLDWKERRRSLILNLLSIAADDLCKT